MDDSQVTSSSPCLSLAQVICFAPSADDQCPSVSCWEEGPSRGLPVSGAAPSSVSSRVPHLLGAGSGAFLWSLRLDLLGPPEPLGPPACSPECRYWAAEGCPATSSDSWMVLSLLMGTSEWEEERGEGASTSTLPPPGRRRHCIRGDLLVCTMKRNESRISKFYHDFVF